MSKRRYIWTTGDGRNILVDDMTESHAKNCLKLMMRRHQPTQYDIEAEGVVSLRKDIDYLPKMTDVEWHELDD